MAGWRVTIAIYNDKLVGLLMDSEMQDRPLAVHVRSLSDFVFDHVLEVFNGKPHIAKGHDGISTVGYSMEEAVVDFERYCSSNKCVCKTVQASRAPSSFIMEMDGV
jgi:hypothetical protein